MPTPSTISTAGLAPGVRFQWISRPAAPGLPRTDIAGFVGIAERGDLHTPTRIESPAQFTSTFGRPLPDAYLADAVQAFFANGGSTCWIVRVANRDTATTATLDLTYPNSDVVAVQLRASSPGTWAHRMTFTFLDLGSGRFTLTLELVEEGLAEQWRAVSFVRGTSGSIDQVLEGSALVDAWILQDRISTTSGGTSDAARIDLLDSAGSPQVRLELKGTQSWDRRVQVTVASARAGEFNLALTPPEQESQGETFENLTLDPSQGNSILRRLAGSRLVQATSLDVKAFAPTVGTVPSVPTTPFVGGADGLAHADDKDTRVVEIEPRHFSGEGAPAGQRWGLATLELIDEISIVAMPDAARLELPPAEQPHTRPADCSQLIAPTVPQLGPDLRVTFPEPQVLDLSTSLIRHCVQLQDRVAVLDSPAPGWNADQVIEWRADFSSSYAALYFPWLLALTDTGELKAVPPSGAVAGILARVSLRDSCAKPPANEPLDGVAALLADVDDLTHSRLNDSSVNAIRSVAGRGLRVLGARTCLAPAGLASGLTTGQQPLAAPDASGLGFLNVRRVVSMVEAVVMARLQSAVFEPNVPRTWRAIERSVRIFLDGVWRAGGLDGAIAAEAYVVRCDATTNTKTDVDQGRLTCIVGIRPPWPAEFVFVRVTASATGARAQEGGTP